MTTVQRVATEDYLERLAGTVAELTGLWHGRNQRGMTDIWAGLHPRDQMAVLGALISIAARCEREHVPMLPPDRLQ
jgi:hypothetical protein